jgi:hypothetical protein
MAKASSDESAISRISSLQFIVYLITDIGLSRLAANLLVSPHTLHGPSLSARIDVLDNHTVGDAVIIIEATPEVYDTLSSFSEWFLVIRRVTFGMDR